ncbi:hypothetical protein CHLV4088_01985 [Campylobacter helveticus]|nr:hypothetical protein [Campylobacter helveticus]
MYEPNKFLSECASMLLNEGGGNGL